MFGLVLAVAVLVAGILLMTLSSDKAVEHSIILTLALGISPLMIGFTLVAVGTDLPEIVNSQAVSGELATITTLYAILASLLVILTLAIRKRMDKRAGIIFITLYLLSYSC